MGMKPAPGDHESDDENSFLLLTNSIRYFTANWLEDFCIDIRRVGDVGNENIIGAPKMRNNYGAI